MGLTLGSTSLVVDAAGAEVGRVIYDAYGQVVENTLPEGLTDRLFTGQVWDATIGLYFYNARYYDPLVGQFTQPDSLVADPMNPAAWNRFSYVYGNPSNLVDPSGHIPIWDILDVGFFAVGLGTFISEPTWGNLGWLALDALGLLPLIPGVGAVRHLGKADDAARVARGGPVWDANVQRWRDPNGRFVAVTQYYHATNTAGASAIRNQIALSVGRLNADFNPVGKKGFYVTKDYAQAQDWANRAARKFGGDPVVLEFAIRKSELQQLNGKIFVKANQEWEQFVLAGRRGTLQHSFDYVEGPLLINPREALMGIAPPVAEGHQLAIFTERAVDLFQRNLLR